MRDVATKLGFRFRRSDLAKWDNMGQVNLVVFHSWTASVHWIADIDLAKRTVAFTNPSGWPIGYWEKFQRYRVENYREALDSPGEWYLDRAKGVLYYWPRKDEDIRKARVVAPVVDRVVHLDGKPQADKVVQHVHFEKMSILHTSWSWDRRRLPDGQANKRISLAAVHGSGVRNARFLDLEVAHTGAHGIFLDEGSQNCLVQRCHVHDAGAGGIYVGPSKDKYPDLPPAAMKVNRIKIDNCLIHDLGHQFHGSHGIWIGRAGDITASHNDISDCDYSPISVGWAWNYRKTYQQNYVVEYNHLHHAGKMLMSDMGGIYTLGVSPGSRLRYNHIHDIWHYPHVNHAKGIYLDQASQHFLVEGNVVHDVASTGFWQHWGQMNTVRNNIFAFAGKSGFGRGGRTQALKEQPLSFRRNIVYQSGPLMVDGCFSNRNLTSDNNVFWHTKQQPVRFDSLAKKGMDLNQWKALGHDRHSVVANPLFRDPERRDFRLKPGSPAYRLGFVDIPVEKIGLYGSPGWVSLPGKKRHQRPSPPPPPPTEEIDCGFEGDTLGQLPDMAGVFGYGGDAKIVVTDDQAAEGKRCVKFVDSKATKPWMPSWHMRSKLPKGRVLFSCDLMNDPKAPNAISLEFRDWSLKKSSTYLAGAGLRLGPDGVMRAGARKIGAYPNGTWIHLEVKFAFSEGKRNGKYTLRIGPKGKPLKEYRELPFGRDDFEVLTWVGISALARRRAVFYLDNLKLKITDTK